MLNANLVYYLNADRLDGKHLDEIEAFPLDADLKYENLLLMSKPVFSPADFGDLSDNSDGNYEYIEAIVTENFRKTPEYYTLADCAASGGYTDVLEYIENIDPENGAELWENTYHTLILGGYEYCVFARVSPAPNENVEFIEAKYGLVDAYLSRRFLEEHALAYGGELWCPFAFILDSDYGHRYDCRTRGNDTKCLIRII